MAARGLEVTDDAAAISYLERIGYCRLSAYWYSFRTVSLVQSMACNHIVLTIDQVRRAPAELADAGRDLRSDQTTFGINEHTTSRFKMLCGELVDARRQSLSP